MDERDLIIGSGGGGGKGGGGGGGGKLKEEKDSLNSTSYAKVVDLLGEGEIQGFATPEADGISKSSGAYNVALLKDIFFNDTPILQADAVVRAGTYTQNGDTITVTSSGHGFASGATVRLVISSGSAATGDYRINTTTSNTFTADAKNNNTTSGSVGCALADRFNFENIELAVRYGTTSQSLLSGFSEIEAEQSVNLEVEKAVPISRSITDDDVDEVRVTITIPQLQEIEKDGDIDGSELRLRILIAEDGGAFRTMVDDTIRGRTGDQYQKDYEINLEGKQFPIELRVERVTDNSNSVKKSNTLIWTSYTEIKNVRLNYRNSAVVATRISAEQFNAIPTRTYRIRGRKVRIPSNGTVDDATGRITYSGTWDGTFGAAQWTSDPAWCLYDLLTNTRFGLGDQILASQLDKFAFYSASQYASALVDSGRRTSGGSIIYEPRFSMNVNLQGQEDAYKLINDLCSVMRCMPYWSTGALTISQDKPADPAFLFTMANVSEEGFSYSSSSQKNRPTVALVAYLDLETRQIAYEQVEDPAGIRKYGIITNQISAFATTSRGQARRLGEWLLYSSQYETEVVAFTASMDAGVIVRPGQVIAISDPVKAGNRRGGRIAAATTTTITVDNTSGLPGSGGSISVILSNGTVQKRTVSSRSGKVITVSSAFSSAPPENSVWIYETSDILPSLWRVLTVQEQDGVTYQVNALSYNPSKYDYIERDKPLRQRDISNLNNKPATPTGLVLSETLYSYQDQVRAKVIARWRPIAGVNEYLVRWRKGNGNWSRVITQSPDHEVLNITPGTFSFQVYALNSARDQSTRAATASINALGKTAPPSNVSGFTHVLDASLGVTLTWNPVSDIDLKDYEIRRGATWDAGTLVTRVAATSYKIGYLDDGTYTYWIKARDTSNVYSTTARSRSITITVPSGPTVTAVIDGSLARLNWTATTGSYNVKHYIVRYGNTFAAGTTLGTFQTTSTSFPVTWSGSRTFWVAAVDLVDNIGTAASVAVVNTPAPAPTVSSAIVGSSVTLTWTEVDGTIPTRFYEIRVGTTYATATVLATIQSTAYSLNADWAGSRTYWISAVDSNGNLGTAAQRVVTIAVAPAPSIDDAFYGEQVQLTWAAVKGSLETAYYQIRRGSTFASATVLATIQGTAYSLKVDWGGTQRFWVAAFDVNSSQGTPGAVDVVVTIPSAPSISQQVIDNNVLLRWTDSTQTLPLVSYELRRGASWSTATVIGTKQGRFTTVFETSSGIYTYWLAGIDTAGNYGTPGSVAASVNQPPDYVLQLDQNSTWAGTETNIYTDPDLGQVVNVNTTETYEEHFTTRSWTSPQDQINAGYSYFLMPSTTTASYVEEVDYGAVLPGTKVSATLTSANVAGNTTITPKVSVKLNAGDAWIDYPGVNEVYATNFRYFKVTYDFTSAGGDDLLVLSALNLRLDSKLKNDAGNGYADSADSGGTTVSFGVPFVDVFSISVTPATTTPVIAVYDFVDAPNPTNFKVLLYNTSGTRVSGNFSWSVRGV
jgi:predicted phage tail protein